MLQQPATTDQLAEFFARFQRLRETKPVLYDAASSSWHLFRYTEVLQVLKDTTCFASVETEAEAAPDATSVMALHPLQRQRVRTLLVQAPTLAP
jgi:cytochrome P450